MKEERGIIFIIFIICDICFILGLYARGNSHVIRLAVPLQILFEAFKDDEDDIGSVHDENGLDVAFGAMEETPSQDLFSESENPEDCEKYVDAPAILAAHSIVDTCLRHCCEFKILNSIFMNYHANIHRTIR